MKSISTQNWTEQGTRQVHIHPDVAQLSDNRRSPLEKLVSIRSFIENGILAGNAIHIKVEPGSSSASSSKKVKFLRNISFPAKSETEAMKFAMYTRLISLLIENLEKNILTTKRDLYYQDVSLFQNQTNVDAIIEDLCNGLGFTNQELGAVAAQKGLCFGDVTLFNGNPNQDQIFTRQQGSFLIPRLNNKSKIQLSNDVQYILVVEKDAVFNLLCDPNSSNRIIITGKGFPDHLAKRFLSLLSTTYPHLPVLGIADIDPYGLNIMKQFKSGGDKSNCFMVNKDQKFDCPRLKLVDITILDFIKKLDCLDLTIRDFTLSSRMLELDFYNDDQQEIWRSELQRSMFFGKKAEIDVIKGSNDNMEINLTQYIANAIDKAMNKA